MGVKDDKFFFLMKLEDGYAVLDESFESAIVGGATFEEIIKYLQLCGAHREDILFVGEDFSDENKSDLFSALPLSIIK